MKSRRTILCSVVSATSIISGCSGNSGKRTENRSKAESENRTSSSTPTRSTEGTTIDPESIKPSAQVVSQATENDPAVVELSLTNTSSNQISVAPQLRSGLPLEWFGSDGEIVLFPESPDSFSTQDVHPKELGCWSWPSEPSASIKQSSFSTTIDPKSTLKRRHEVYFNSDQRSESTFCYLPGEYTIHGSFELVEQSYETGPLFSVTYEIAIDESSEISIKIDN